MTVTLVLPYPISANRYWRSFVPRGKRRAVTVVSDEAKAYKEAVAQIAAAAGIRQPITGRVAIHLDLYPHRPQDWQRRARKDPHAWDDTVQCIDLDNARKVIYDAMRGIVIVDDRFVRQDSAERHIPDGEGRVVVTVTEANALKAARTGGGKVTADRDDASRALGA